MKEKQQPLLILLRERERERENLEIYLQELVDIAGSKDLVHIGKLLGLISREVRSKQALLGAPPPQQFAGSTG